jgi:Fe-S-cluster containining protein
MTDGFLRGAIKRVVCAIVAAEMRLRAPRRGNGRYELAGDCRLCAQCCDAPSIRVGRLVWFLAPARRLFLAWQRRINGFELTERDHESRVFVFRCTHFDTGSRRCDSYATRPFMCHDYPRLLLGDPWPQFLLGCGYRARARRGTGLRAAIEGTQLNAEQKAALSRKLHLD